MKSRELHTTQVLIISNYTINPISSGQFIHTFTPESTTTTYQFTANQEAIFIEGERYNIGFRVNNGVNLVDPAACSKADEVIPTTSHYVARLLGEELRVIETKKSDDRVVHTARDGHYLGKKYAWRIYGMSVARNTFDDYLGEIGHPMVNCLTGGSQSTAYKDHNIDVAMDKLINSCVKVGSTGNRYKSNLLPLKKWFMVKGIFAISDKK